MKLKKHLLTGIAAIMLATGMNAQTATCDSNFYIYLAFGQSNMEGNARPEKEDTDASKVSERFQVMNTADTEKCPSQPLFSWRKAVPPLARCSAGLGPVDYFGRTMVANTPDSIRIGVIVVAIGGCSIELFDTAGNADLNYLEGQADWLKNFASCYANRPYIRLVEAAKEAQKVGVIKGILLHQGETNTGSPTWTTQVKTIYDRLIDELNLNPEEVPILAGEVVADGACAYHNTIIKTLPNTIPNAHVVSSQKLAGVSDKLHFTAESYRILGYRYAKKMFEIMGTPLPTLPPIVVDTTITVESEFTWRGKTYTKSEKITKTFLTRDDRDSTVNINLIVTNPTAINENESAEGSLDIYPNPASTEVSINVPECAVGYGLFKVYTPAGIEVYSTDVIAESETINIDTWANGVYIVKIVDKDGNVWRSKFIKKNN